MQGETHVRWVALSSLPLPGTTIDLRQRERVDTRSEARDAGHEGGGTPSYVSDLFLASHLHGKGT